MVERARFSKATVTAEVQKRIDEIQITKARGFNPEVGSVQVLASQREVQGDYDAWMMLRSLALNLNLQVHTRGSSK